MMSTSSLANSLGKEIDLIGYDKDQKLSRAVAQIQPRISPRHSDMFNIILHHNILIHDPFKTSKSFFNKNYSLLHIC